MDRSILYITDNSLEDWLEDFCIEKLLVVSRDIPIVSVSQKPMMLGHNICVGDIGRCGYSIDRQLYEGLKVIDTKWVALAEHDCVYCPEHFWWTPPDGNFFWYNDNVWLLQLKNLNHPEMDGQYSYKRARRVQSQLICDTKMLLEATEKKLEILSDPAWMARHPSGRLGEPGAADNKRAMKMSDYRTLRHLKGKLKDYTTNYAARDWATRIPNIDIRHGGNLTGPRRGNKRRWELPPWGRMEDLFSGT